MRNLPESFRQPISAAQISFSMISSFSPFYGLIVARLVYSTDENSASRRRVWIKGNINCGHSTVSFDPAPAWRAHSRSRRLPLVINYRAWRSLYKGHRLSITNFNDLLGHGPASFIRQPYGYISARLITLPGAKHKFLWHSLMVERN